MWTENCVILANNANDNTSFSITDTKLYVPVVTLSVQDNTKLLEALKSGFKRTINCNKYQSKVSTENKNHYLDFLNDPSFQGINRLSVLSFQGQEQITSYKLATVEINNCNVMINKSVRNDLITSNNIRKIATSQRDDDTTACFLDYDYFKNYYKVIAIDLRKQQALHADQKAIQQINKKLNPIVTELFIKGRKLNNTFAFITQFYLVPPQNIGLNFTDYFVMKFPCKRELQ